MNYRLLLSIICLLLAFGTTGFAQDIPDPNTAVIQPNAPRLQEARGRRYRLNPGDVLEVIYRYTPEFNQTVTIHPDGYIVLEIVGELKVSDLTLEETRKAIIRKASERLKDPEITLLLKEFQKPYYIVAGEILAPGKFEMNENITALQAVMVAGGFKDSAKTSKVVVFRRINKDQAKVMVIDLKNIKSTGDLENDLNLESGDIIFVPQNRFSRFEKYIKLTNLANILRPFVP